MKETIFGKKSEDFKEKLEKLRGEMRDREIKLLNEQTRTRGKRDRIKCLESWRTQT